MKILYMHLEENPASNSNLQVANSQPNVHKFDHETYACAHI